tara:strand:+ start:45 stop:323 length:279 start_codon:yes stop_codon:yes gene_type:complete
MGWEVAQNKSNNGLFIRYVFFCNTADIAFGPVFWLECDSIREFYDAWNEVNKGIDPRIIDSEALWDCIVNMKEYFGEDISDYRESAIVGVDE